jgi:hypothetical protein
MPELPDADRTPQPSPRLLASARKMETTAPSGGRGRNPNSPILPRRDNAPTTVYVGGSSRAVVNSVAFALAETIDLTPFWLDVKDSKSASDGPDPASLGWIPPDRLFVSENGDGLEIDVEGAMKSLWTIVRADEPASVLSSLTDFLRLPELIQEILSATAPTGGPKALVAANSDRVAHLFPRTAEGLQRFLATLAASSLSIVAAHTGPGVPGRFGFSTVFRVDAASPADWMEGTIVCEKGIDQGPFAVGRSTRLSDVPGIARVFRGLLPAKH